MTAPSWTPASQRAYVVQIADLCRAGLVALDELARVAGGVPPHPDEWRCLANLMIPCGRLSRFFFPSRTKGADGAFRKVRGKELRKLFDIGEDWLLLDRAVRNAEEHFDERFDSWLMQQPTITPELIESSAPLRIGTPPMRSVDTTSWTVHVDNASIELVPIRSEIVRIVVRCAEVETLAGPDMPQLAYLLATLPAWPAELTLAAPTRRPNESILSGTIEAAVPSDPSGSPES